MPPHDSHDASSVLVVEGSHLARWLKSIKEIQCVVIEESSSVNYEWRRLQTHEAQAERQKKNLVQKALIFNARALQLSLEERGVKNLVQKPWS